MPATTSCPKAWRRRRLPEAIRKAEARAVVEAKRQAQLDEAAQLLAGQMAGASIRIVAKAGSKGRLFGSVTQADIAEEVGKLLGQEVDRHQVLLAEPIKETGEYQVTIQLSKNVRPVIAVAGCRRGRAHRREGRSGGNERRGGAEAGGRRSRSGGAAA